MDTVTDTELKIGHFFYVMFVKVEKAIIIVTEDEYCVDHYGFESNVYSVEHRYKISPSIKKFNYIALTR